MVMLMMTSLTGFVLVLLVYLAESMPHHSTASPPPLLLFLDDPHAGECIDRGSSCHKIGRKLPLSRCYDVRQYTRCCATCSRLRLPLPGCQFGDKEVFCSSIGKEQPSSDCYSHNRTCCQTCHIYDSGIPGCPFGDRVAWCSEIGDRYETRSCYDHEIHCCDTCRQYRTGIAGCPYGDRLTWCPGIGSIFPLSFCATHRSECCQTCHALRQRGHSFDVPETTSSSDSFTQSPPPPARHTTTPTPSDSITSPAPNRAHLVTVDQTTDAWLNANSSSDTVRDIDNAELHPHSGDSHNNSDRTLALPGQRVTHVTKSLTAPNEASTASSASDNAVTRDTISLTNPADDSESQETQSELLIQRQQDINSSHSNIAQNDSANNISTFSGESINETLSDLDSLRGNNSDGVSSYNIATAAHIAPVHSTTESVFVAASAEVTSVSSEHYDLNERHQNTSNGRDSRRNQATSAVSSASRGLTSQCSLQLTVCYLVYFLSAKYFSLLISDSNQYCLSLPRS